MNNLQVTYSSTVCFKNIIVIMCLFVQTVQDEVVCVLAFHIKKSFDFQVFLLTCFSSAFLWSPFRVDVAFCVVSTSFEGIGDDDIVLIGL